MTYYSCQVLPAFAIFVMALGIGFTLGYIICANEYNKKLKKESE